MKRGEVWWVNFDPKIGGEIGKRRPAVILSHDIPNQSTDCVQVIPISTETKEISSDEIMIGVGSITLKAMTHQSTSVNKTQMFKFYDTISDEDMEAIETVIRLSRLWQIV